MSLFRLQSLFLLASLSCSCWAADTRFARSDSDARYIHWIDLYDVDNRKITPESNRPLSTLKTCGRCHDYETISHGWHFNAFDSNAVAGRSAEPWIWTDPRTGTQLPLSYRDWPSVFDPRQIGISAWQMTKHFGGRLPGGGPGIAPAERDDPAAEVADDAESTQTADSDGDAAEPNRWVFSGSLEIDCLVCHASSGSYDFNSRREQVEQENFAWATTAGLRLGTVEGNVSRIKDDADPSDEATQERMPKVQYDASRFGSDGTVFIDLVRKPDNNACYQCHSNRIVGDNGIEPRWVHDQDVHLRAGMACVDCHRHGIDHHIVRGFTGEENPSGHAVETLSCAGCHLGPDLAAGDGESIPPIAARPGRLGSPHPRHAGLPPIHFEKLSCTACHGGPAPRNSALRIMTSLAHGLGSKDHRTGQEWPAILGPVYTRCDDGRIYPQRAMWPAFWGVLEDGKIQPLPPEQAYAITRRALRVRTDLVSELLQPKLSSSELKELLGEDRARVKPEQWSDEETVKVESAQADKGRIEFDEKVFAALQAIEEEMEVDSAVYVSSGTVYARGDEPDALKTLSLEDQPSLEMVRWPIAHNVRPAGWSLGSGGCVECHRDDGWIFASTVTPLGPGPESNQPVSMASLQGVSADQRLAWNELFKGRADFKFIVGGAIAVLLMTIMIGVGAAAARLGGRARSA